MSPSHSFAPHLAYSAAWTPGAPGEAPFPQGAAPADRPEQERLGIGGLFRLAASHAFERTTSGFFLEENRIAQAEEKAGTDWDPAEAIGGSDVAVTLPQDLADFANPRALSESEFRAAGLDRGGRIAWMPTTTRQRAEIEAETFDRRQREARLLELNSDTLGRKVVGFGAAFLANLPDPINLVPIYGAGTAGATFGARVLRGATEGLTGTALADMALVPAANRRGDAVGFAGVALDLTFGALFGAGFGTAGGLLHNRRVAGLAGEQNRLAELLGEAGYESADAGRLAASAIAHIADVPRRKELSDAVRRNLAGMDRLGAGKLLDRMMIAIRDGENPDVGKWAAELGMKGHFKPGKMVDLEPDIQSGVPVWSAQMPWNELLTVSKNWYDKNLAGSRVTVNWDNGAESLHGDIIFRATDQGMGKLRSNAHPDKLRLIPFLKTLLEKAEYLGTETPRRLKHARQGMIIHKARSFVRLDNKLLGVELTIRQDSNGRLFYDHFVFDYPRISGKKKKFPPESSEGAVGPNESRGGTGKVVTTTASDQQPALDTGLTARGTSITERSGKVNQLTDTFAISNMRLTDHTPDFTAPAPEPKIMPHALDKATRADAKMFDAEEFGALDREVSRIAEEGRMTPEYAAEQTAINTELARIREETAAALPDGVVRNGENAPDLYAHLLLTWAQRREARSGVPVAESLRRCRARAGRDDGPGSRGENGAEGFFQPLNERVDLEHKIPITSIERSAPHQSLKEIRSYIQNNVAGKILERFKSGVINKDTGFVITMSKSDLGEHLKTDASSVNIRDQFEAVCALPELMERALLVESHPDVHQRPEVKLVHRFYAPLKIADAMYTVKLTVNEFVDGHLSVDFPSSLKLYHHRLEKKMPSGNMPGLPANGATTGPAEGTFNISLRQLLEDVKDSEGNVFFVADNALRQKDPGRLRQNGDEFFQASISDLTDSSIVWKNRFSEIPAKPLSIPLQKSSLKEAYEQAREAYSKKYFELADGSMVRVSTEGLKETGSKRAPKENTAILGALPEVLKNTYVFRTEKSTDKKGQTMHGIAAVVIDGEPMLVRSTFKQVLEKGTPFWKYYGSRIMKTARKEGTPVTQVLQESTDSKPILHVPSLGNTLYDWIQAVNDSGKRFPEDRTMLYQGEDFAAPRGSITPVDEGYLIRLYDRADLSTMLHETGHFFLLEMEQDIRAGIADASTIKDFAIIRRWLGAQGDAPFTRAQHEAFARGFERYLREGKAPSRELESIFARFRQWLVHLYRKATSLDVELNDDVRAVFDRMLAAEQNGIEFSSVKPEQSAVVSARFKSKDQFFLQRDGKAPESTLFQPMNSGVDPDLKITALPVMEETGNTWEYTKGKGRRDIINTITGILKNDYTKQEYELTRPGAEHLINSALRRGLGGLPHIAAVRNIHDLFNISIPVEIHADRKNQQDVSKMHHFFAPMLYREKTAESIYAVHILVKEYDGERRVELAGVQKLYDLQLEKKMPIEILGARPYQTAGGRPSQQTSFQIPLRQLLEGVNDSEGVPYFPENSSF